MARAQEIVEKAKAAGLHWRLTNGKIAIGPARLLTPELIAEIREHRTAILAYMIPPEARGLSWDRWFARAPIVISESAREYLAEKAAKQELFSPAPEPASVQEELF